MSDEGPTRQWDDPGHARAYLAREAELPHRHEGDAVIVESVVPPVRRVLDIGTGDGRVLAQVLNAYPDAGGVALDHNPTMLEAARHRFADHPMVDVVDHDLAEPLPEGLGPFDAVVSALAIHHFGPERRLALYREVRTLLRSGGVFADLDLVRSPTEALHDRFIDLVPWDRSPDKAWDRHPSVADRQAWLDEAGFVNVECVWKWRELALLVGEVNR